MTERRGLGLAYLGLAFASLFWAGNAVVARGTVGMIPPLAMSFWRWVIALLVLLPFALPHLRREWRVAVIHWPQLLALAVLSVGTYNTLLYLAAQSTTAVNITLISATMPVVIALTARLLLGQRLEGLQWGGIALALCGVAIIVLLGTSNAVAGGINRGDLIIMIAVLVWGLYSVLLRWRPLPLHPLTVLLLLVALGLPVIFPFYLWELAAGSELHLTAQTVPALLYVGVFPSLLAYLFWNHGVSIAGPNRAGMFIYLIPMFTVLMAGALLGEKLYERHALGAGLILLGLYLSTRIRPIRPS
ncbi:MAG TPA: DMT family transporter [Gammaproteobacteria bacterium]|nr:DMT family transporter [Gammaproteobacteria bacterium]